jgi:hypothetical protein
VNTKADKTVDKWVGPTDMKWVGRLVGCLVALLVYSKVEKKVDKMAVMMVVMMAKRSVASRAVVMAVV